MASLGGGLWTVVLGDWDRDNREGVEVEMLVDSIVVHPNFTEYQNDIALLKLPQPLPHMTPVCLPPDDQLLHPRDSYIGLR